MMCSTRFLQSSTLLAVIGMSLGATGERGSNLIQSESSVGRAHADPVEDAMLPCTSETPCPVGEQDSRAKATLARLQGLVDHAKTNDASDEDAEEQQFLELLRLSSSSEDRTPFGDLVDLIKVQIARMKATVNTSHVNDQTTLNTYTTSFTFCVSAKTSGDGQAVVLNTTKTTQSTNHTACRETQGTTQTNYTNCVATQNATTVARDSSCTVANNAIKIPNVNLVPAPFADETYRAWLIRGRDWFLSELANVDASQTTCDEETESLNNTVVTCEGSTGNGGLKRQVAEETSSCDSNQSNLERTACTYAEKVQDTCSDYKRCFNNAKVILDTQLANMQVEEESRQREWRMLGWISCYLDVFSAANGSAVNITSMNACKEKTSDTSFLNLTYPILPVAPPATCPDTPRPCNAAYMAIEYSSLPAGAPARNCTLCAEPVTTVTTTTPAPAASLTDLAVADADTHMDASPSKMSGDHEEENEEEVEKKEDAHTETGTCRDHTCTNLFGPYCQTNEDTCRQCRNSKWCAGTALLNSETHVHKAHSHQHAGGKAGPSHQHTGTLPHGAKAVKGSSMMARAAERIAQEEALVESDDSHQEF